MRHLKIQNFGPLKEAELEIGRLNIIVGPQSSGKSSALKVAAYCAWLEKRLELTQDLSIASWENLEEHLLHFYNLEGYFSSSTVIEYKTDCVILICRYKSVSAEWSTRRWNYKRSKIAYIPAERNIVSVVSNWQKMQAADNILEFMTEWDIARKSRSRALNILNLGVQYSYDKSNNTDNIVLETGVNLALSSASSGLQSLIPLYVNLNYLNSGQYLAKYRLDNYISKSENSKFYELLLEKYSKGELDERTLYGGPHDGRLGTSEYTIRGSKLYNNYVSVKNSQIYLEEPENNLFPPEQVILTDWLIEMGNNRFRNNVIFLATHSPYIVNHFLEREKIDYRLFITLPQRSGKSIVKSVLEEDIQKMYDNGVDVFFNYEAYQ